MMSLILIIGAIGQGLLIGWMLRRLIAVERVVMALKQRFQEAGIDLTVTKPLTTAVQLPDNWEELPEGLEGTPSVYLADGEAWGEEVEPDRATRS